MQAVGGQTEHDVADLHGLPRDNFFALHHAHNKSRQIVFTMGIEAWHFSGFAADQCAAVMFARVGDSFDHLFSHRRIELPGSQIIHEK